MHYVKRGRSLQFMLTLTRVVAHKVPSRIKLLASFAMSRVDNFTDECNLCWATGAGGKLTSVGDHLNSCPLSLVRTRLSFYIEFVGLLKEQPAGHGDFQWKSKSTGRHDQRC